MGINSNKSLKKLKTSKFKFNKWPKICKIKYSSMIPLKMM